MKVLECSGTPYEIGFKHGSVAQAEVNRSIAFYTGMFEETSSKTWPQVRDTALNFGKQIEQQWPAFSDEMKGLASGAGVDYLDIVALNVRTEIAFGQFSDGCTSLAWQTEKRSFLSQNWDWSETQKPNLILLKIHQSGKPSIAMVTEAGIIGKIGFNSSGVGTCMNAIRVLGVNETKLPVHLGLRAALESRSAAEAVEKLRAIGMASSAHILVADSTTAYGCEFTPTTFETIRPDGMQRVMHSNHLLLKHHGVVDTAWLPDSFPRINRIEQLANELATKSHDPSWEEFSRLFEDEDGLPTAICRQQTGSSTIATLFNIVTDLKSRTSVVRVGRPNNCEETITMSL